MACNTCFVDNKSESSTNWKISKQNRIIPINEILSLLSVDNLLLELLNPEANFKAFPLDVFFKSTIFVNEILPVVFRRRDKYDVNSDCWPFGSIKFGGAKRRLSPVSTFNLPLLLDDEPDHECFGVVGAVVRRPPVA